MRTGQGNGAALLQPDTDVEDKQLEEKVIWIKRGRLSPDPQQPREHFDEVKLQELARSIGAVGQKVPIIVVKHPYEEGRYFIVDGERRWRACGIAGVESLKTIVSQETDPRELFKQSAIANFSREGHTTLEIMHALARIKRDFPKEKNGDIAAMFGKSLGWVQNHLALLRLPDEVQELMQPSRPKSKRLVFSVALQLVPLTKNEQIKFAHEFCEGKRSAKSTTMNIARHRLIGGGTEIKRHKKSHTRQKITTFTIRLEEDTELIALMGSQAFKDAFEGHNKNEIVASLKNLEIARGHIETIEHNLNALLK